MPLLAPTPNHDSEEFDVTVFIRATAIRALRTFAQALIAAIGAAVLITDIDWWVVLSTAGLAALLSVLNSVATGLPEVDSPAPPAA